VETGAGAFTVGVLVQANYGRRHQLRVDGVPVGQAIPLDQVPAPAVVAGDGSIIVVVATDAPLHPGQCDRLAQRAGLGLARVGGTGDNGSGDIFFAFSTAHRGLLGADFAATSPPIVDVPVLADAAIGPLFEAVIHATEEAIVNALVAAETMVGCDGVVAHGLDPKRLQELLTAR
jgi:D-aminopeptidase